MLPILNQSLWRDEAFSALISLKNPLEIISLSMRDTTPPLYYLLLHYWILMFGTSEVSLRSLSFIFHLLLVLMVFFLARKLIKSKSVQFIIAFSTLLNPFLLQYAFEARPYSLLAFLSVLSIYFVISKKYILSSAFLTLAVFTHNYSLLTLVAFVFWFIYKIRFKLKEKKEFLQLFTLPILAVLIWGGVIWQQWVKVASGFWIKPATFSLFLNSFEKYSKGNLNYPSQPMLFTFTLIVCFLAFGYWLWREQKEEQSRALLLISFVVIIPTLITYFVSALFVPIYDERCLIATVPPLIVLIGYSLHRLFEVNNRVKNLIIGVIAVYAFLLIQSSEQILSITTKPAINWGVNQILSKAKNGDIIIPQSNLNFLETKYYVKISGREMPVFAYSSDGRIPFYIGSVLFEQNEIITEIPKNKRIWQIFPDGGFKLLK